MKLAKINGHANEGRDEDKEEEYVEYDDEEGEDEEHGQPPSTIAKSPTCPSIINKAGKGDKITRDETTIICGALELMNKEITALKKGAYLLKYGRRGKPKFCPFWLSKV